MTKNIICNIMVSDIKKEAKLMVFEKVKSVIADQLGVDEDSITMDSSFVDDLGADSLDIVELIMGLETEFDLEIPDEEAENILSVGDAVSYIKDKI